MRWVGKSHYIPIWLSCVAKIIRNILRMWYFYRRIFWWILSYLESFFWSKLWLGSKKAILWKWAFRVHETLIFKVPSLQNLSGNISKIQSKMRMHFGVQFWCIFDGFSTPKWWSKPSKIDEKNHWKFNDFLNAFFEGPKARPPSQNPGSEPWGAMVIL